MNIPQPEVESGSPNRSLKVLTALAVLLLLGWIGWRYTSSADYRARRALKQAEAALQNSNPLQAARFYEQALFLRPGDIAPARHGLQLALEAGFKSASAATVAQTLRFLNQVPAGLNTPDPLVAEPVQRALARVEEFRGPDPEGAADILSEVIRRAGSDQAPQLLPRQVELLRSSVALHPDHIGRVSELAQLYEAQHQSQAACQLLQPYGERLGATEGARILGEYLLQHGELEQAITLLSPYLQQRLQTQRQLEQEYSQLLDQTAAQAQRTLKAGQAGAALERAFTQAGPERQRELMAAYVAHCQQTDPDCQRLLGSLRQNSSLLTVTLDLSLARLNHARSLSDPAQRRAEMEATEKLLRSVGGIASNNDEYRLFLGQTYYWLGRAAEGEQIFEQFLAGHARNYHALLQLANLWRGLGEYAQTRALAEEAFSKATSATERFDAARLRAHTPRDVEDQIAWLQRCNPAELTSRIDLNHALGLKALNEGHRPQAAEYLRKALADYAALPQEAATLNNSGLLSLELYQATGEPQDHRQGLARLEKAYALSPANSLLLKNLAFLFAESAQMDLVSNAIRYDWLHEPPNQLMLDCLYQDQAGYQQQLELLRQNEHLNRASGYLAKALLLMPRDADLAELGLQIYSLRNDTNGLAKLQQQLSATPPDLAETLAATRDSYNPAKAAEAQQEAQTQLQHYQELLQTPAIQTHPLSSQYVRLQLNRSLQALARAQGPLDSQALLQQAQALETQAPSAASRANLLAAGFYRADEQVMARSPAYAQLRQPTRLALPPEYALALVLEHNGPGAELIRTNAEVQAAAARLKASLQTLPAVLRLCDWALLSALDSPTAAAAAAYLAHDTARRQAETIRRQLNPLSATALLNEYWLLRLNTNNAAAEALYRQALAQGLPLPPLPTP